MKKRLVYAALAVAFVFSETSDAGFLRKLIEKSDDKDIKEQVENAANPIEEASVVQTNPAPAEGGSPAAEAPNPPAPAPEPAPAVSPNPPAQEAPAAIEPNPEPKKPIVGDPIVLKIGSKEFHRSQIMEDARMLPPQMLQSVPPEKLFTMLQDQKIRNYLLIEHVKKLGLENTKEFREELERAREGLLIRMYIIRNIAPKAENEATLKARYAKYRAEYKSMKEYHLLHIMVSTEEAAKNIINELNNGKDFATLAKEKSEAPTKEAGGDGGFVPIDILPPELKSKIAGLKPGEFTKEPIKLDNGYNIFKVVEIRDSTPMKFEEAVDMLRQMVLRDEMTKVLNDLEKKASVTRFNEDGSPITVK